MSDHVVPTQEQHNLAREYLSGSFMPSASDIEKLANLIAQREHLAMSKGAAIAWGSLWDATAPADVIKAAEDVKSIHRALDIYVSGDEKADALLRKAGLDDTVNVVPRLVALVERDAGLRAEIASLNKQIEIIKETAAASEDKAGLRLYFKQHRELEDAHVEMADRHDAAQKKIRELEEKLKEDIAYKQALTDLQFVTEHFIGVLTGFKKVRGGASRSDLWNPSIIDGLKRKVSDIKDAYFGDTGIAKTTG